MIIPPFEVDKRKGSIIERGNVGLKRCRIDAVDGRALNEISSELPLRQK